MKTHRFIIPGNPVPWSRPGKHGARFFDTQKLDKLNIGLLIRNQFENFTPYENVPLSMDILCIMPIPKVSRKRHDEMLNSYHIYRPDSDNLEKLILDSCTGVLYKDDCIIAHLALDKIYGDDPRTEITIAQLERKIG